MSKKKALICGISGQDGAWLSQLLLKKDYCVSQFTDDYIRYPECNGPDFCQIWCENEFGSAVLEKRQTCISLEKVVSSVV